MANISREERQRRHEQREKGQIDAGSQDGARDEERQRAKLGQEFGGVAYVDLDDQRDQLNQIDERLEDRRPGTVRDVNTGEAFEDKREFAGDLGKAANQMIGRTFITENQSPHPHIDNPVGPVWPNVQDPRQATQEGEEILVMRGYQPHPEREGGPLPEKIQAGTVTRLPMKDAKRLVNMGAAKFTETD